MNRRHTSHRRGFPSNAAKKRIQGLIPGRDSVCFRVLNAAIVLSILIAVATVLIAPQIDMPDTVMRLHHVSSHSSGAHGTSNSFGTGIVLPTVAVISDGASLSSENLDPPDGLQARLSAVMRC
jgi:hypothetical protein